MSSIDYGLVLATASGQFQAAFGVSNEGPTNWSVSNAQGTVVGRACDGSGVFLLDATEASARLVADRSDVSDAVISGDGQTIVFAQPDAKRIVAIDAQTDETREVASGESASSVADLALSYDGSHVAWQNGFMLLEASTHGGPVEPIAGSQGGGPGDDTAHDPAYATDGRMAYVAGNDSESTIVLTNAIGGEAEYIPFTQGTVDMLTWSPQSNRLAFYSRQTSPESRVNARVSLMTLDLTTRETRTLIGADAGLNPITRPQWSYDEPARLLVELDDPTTGSAQITSIVVDATEITPLFSMPFAIGAFPSWVPSN